MTHTVQSTIATVRDLGFVCRHEDGEYRLARRLTDYRNYKREDQRRLQEMQAYYTTDSDDCIDTAVAWATNLGWQQAA